MTVKAADGLLVPAAIPKVIFVKGDHWYDDSGQLDPASDRGLEASIHMLLLTQCGFALAQTGLSI